MRKVFSFCAKSYTKDEMIRLEELEQARKEVEKTLGTQPLKQNMFKTV